MEEYYVEYGHEDCCQRLMRRYISCVDIRTCTARRVAVVSEVSNLSISFFFVKGPAADATDAPQP
jgi:hypothetical protein